MARRKKSVLDLARQAGSISARITAQRVGRWGTSAYNYDDDQRLRRLEMRALNAYSKYVNNIRKRQGVVNDPDNPITDARLNNRKYSSNTYMGLSNG